MKIVNLCYPCSCGAAISFVFKLGTSKEVSFAIPCKVCKTTRKVVISNYMVSLSDEYNRPTPIQKFLRFFHANKTH